jgi:hypothetical protein
VGKAIGKKGVYTSKQTSEKEENADLRRKTSDPRARL